MALFDRDEWRAHGWIVPAAMAGNMLVATHNYALGALLHPIEQETGWARAQISLGPMLPGLLAIVVAPMVGIMVDRFGPRRIALAGVPLFCLALACMGLAGASVATWLALYIVLGLTSLLVFPTVWTSALNWRFDRNRGVAMAFAISGTGIAAMVIPVTAAYLAQAEGWRTAYSLLALGMFLIAFPLTWLLFDRTPAKGENRRAAEQAVSRAEILSAIRTPKFIALALAAVLFAIMAGTMTVNAVPILLGEGFDNIGAAAIAGLIGLGSMGGRLAGGFLLDRFPANRVAAVTVCVPAISIVTLLVTHDNWNAAAAACLLMGLAVGAEYDSCAFLTSRLFPLRMFGTLFGSISGLLLFGTSVSPVVSNFVYDRVRSYDNILIGVLFCIVVAASLFLWVGPGTKEQEGSAP